ncbi:hypothetical protein C9I86_03570 [Photobacterium sp. NCIMB 13483]|uniref:hypothetical protein n=1 Tax=Photobacterium sp. NCIMB 13483 TaxID=2022103 RepID=UPI000D15DC5A|nr:hypothetical protein [Photobacterium sp. NCIMB 13483]PST94440.1 hypothetical protein C9I86_03570 [Photobacterium sp. NCIMB 13483]
MKITKPLLSIITRASRKGFTRAYFDATTKLIHLTTVNGDLWTIKDQLITHTFNISDLKTFIKTFNETVKRSSLNDSIVYATANQISISCPTGRDSIDNSVDNLTVNPTPEPKIIIDDLNTVDVKTLLKLKAKGITFNCNNGEISAIIDFGNNNYNAFTTLVNGVGDDCQYSYKTGWLKLHRSIFGNSKTCDYALNVGDCVSVEFTNHGIKNVVTFNTNILPVVKDIEKIKTRITKIVDRHSNEYKKDKFQRNITYCNNFIVKRSAFIDKKVIAFDKKVAQYNKQLIALENTRVRMENKIDKKKYSHNQYGYDQVVITCNAVIAEKEAKVYLLEQQANEIADLIISELIVIDESHSFIETQEIEIIDLWHDIANEVNEKINEIELNNPCIKWCYINGNTVFDDVEINFIDDKVKPVLPVKVAAVEPVVIRQFTPEEIDHITTLNINGVKHSHRFQSLSEDDQQQVIAELEPLVIEKLKSCTVTIDGDKVIDSDEWINTKNDCIQLHEKMYVKFSSEKPVTIMSHYQPVLPIKVEPITVIEPYNYFMQSMLGEVIPLTADQIEHINLVRKKNAITKKYKI